MILSDNGKGGYYTKLRDTIDPKGGTVTGVPGPLILGLHILDDEGDTGYCPSFLNRLELMKLQPADGIIVA